MQLVSLIVISLFGFLLSLENISFTHMVIIIIDEILTNAQLKGSLSKRWEFLTMPYNANAFDKNAMQNAVFFVIAPRLSCKQKYLAYWHELAAKMHGLGSIASVL